MSDLPELPPFTKPQPAVHYKLWVAKQEPFEYGAPDTRSWDKKQINPANLDDLIASIKSLSDRNKLRILDEAFHKDCFLDKKGNAILTKLYEVAKEALPFVGYGASVSHIVERLESVIKECDEFWELK